MNMPSSSPAQTTRALLVGVDFGKGDFAASLEELGLLVKSAGAVPIISIIGRRSSPDAALFVGSGKAEEIARAVLFLVADDGGFITGSTLSINGGQHMY